MADNITLNTNDTSGAIVATDQVGTDHYQHVKLTDGTADSSTEIASGNGTSTNALRVTVSSDSTGVLSVDDNGGSLTVDGTVTANLSATDNAVLDQIEVNTSYGDSVGGGAEATALRVTIANDSTGVVSIDDNGGSITVDGTVTADLGVNNDVTVTGGNAHDGTTLGNPVLGGARATNSIEGVTQVANADLTYIQADLNGVLLTRNATTLEELISTSQSVTTTTSTAATNFGAGGAGIHNYITSVTVFNDSATDTHVLLQDGSGGTTRWVFPAPQTGGATHNFDPPLKQTTANTALYFAAGDAVTTLYISINGFQAQG